MIRIGVITASDKGAAGEREDLSGRMIKDMLQDFGQVAEYKLVPDEKKQISSALLEMAQNGMDLILTTGGTGLAPRDVTPEATLAVIDRQVPGIPEAMRSRSMEITDRAMLSRAVAGTIGDCLVINLPGSPKGVRECLEAVLPVLGHALEILKGTGGECARKEAAKK